MQPLHATVVKLRKLACNPVQPVAPRFAAVASNAATVVSASATLAHRAERRCNCTLRAPERKPFLNEQGSLRVERRMRTLVLSLTVPGGAAAMALIAPTDPGRALEGVAAPLWEVADAR